MQLTYIPVVFFLSGIFSFLTATLVWRRRQSDPGRTLAILLFCVALWSLFDGLGLMAVEMPVKIFFAQCAYAPRLAVVVLLFFFSLEFTGLERFLTRRNRILIALIPALTVLIVWTNQWHFLNWSSFTYEAETNSIVYGRGPWFWFYIGYIYLLFAASTFALLYGSIRQPKPFRIQTGTVIIAALMPIASNVVNLFWLSRTTGIDFTVVVLFLSGALLAVSMSRFSLFDLMPIARHFLVDNMMEGVIVLDAKLRVIDINPQAEQYLSIPPNSLDSPDGMALPDWFVLSELISPDEDKLVELCVNATPQAEQVLSVRSTRLSSARVELLGWLILVQDVSERVHAVREMETLNRSLESQVAQRTMEIQQERDRSDAILQSIGDAIVTVNLDHCITYVNNSFLALTGYASEDLMGQPLGASCKDLEKILHVPLMPEQVMRQGSGTIRRRNGTTYAAALVATPLRDQQGEVGGYVISHTDVSHHQALKRARSRFIANISHELRTPVTNIILYVNLVARAMQKNQTDQIGRYIDTLAEQSQQLKILVDDILTIAELDSEPPASTDEASYKQLVHPPLLMAEIVQLFQKTALRKDVRLINEGPGVADLYVRGEKDQLLQALGEIVENAILFTPGQGQVTLRINANNPANPDWLAFEVRDTGVGMTDEDKEHLFDRFYRGSVADTGSVPGSGLGLSIALAITKRHGGWIELGGEVGEGSRVSLWLPAVEHSPDPADSDTSALDSLVAPESQNRVQLSKPKIRFAPRT